MNNDIVAVPPFLYKYTSAKRAIEVLRTNQVYFSHRKELNDPHDGKFVIDLSTEDKKEKHIDCLAEMVHLFLPLREKHGNMRKNGVLSCMILVPYLILC